MKLYLITILVLFVFCSCEDNSTNNITSEPPIVEPVIPSLLSTEAESYLNEALDIMENFSINKYEIDWPPFRIDVHEYAGEAQTESETYNAIRYGLENLSDNHSFFLEPPNNQLAGLLKTTEINNTLHGQRLTDKIGYIRITGFIGVGEAIQNFAETIQYYISVADANTVKGWVVDLRQNFGGNMWPMLAGVGPILGEGVAGKFIDPDNNTTEWGYRNGYSFSSDEKVITVSNEYTLYNRNPWVAVLTDNATASSGEAITVAFVGRSKTRSFGTATRGLSTANAGFPLRDSAKIYLTVAVFVDRTGTRYGGKINPNEVVVGSFHSDPLDDDKVVKRAMEWLESNF